MSRLPKFTVHKKADGRDKPWCFSVPPSLWGEEKEKFFYFSHKKEAEAEAKKWRRKLRTLSKTVTLEGDTAFNYEYREELIKKAENKLNKSFTEILHLAEKTIERIKHHRTLNEVIERLHQKQLTRANDGKIQMRSIVELNNYLTRQFATYQDFGETLIYEIDSELLDDYWQDENTNRSRTYHRYINQVFNYACDKSYTLENPFFKWEDGDDIPDEISILTPDQGRLLLEQGNKEMIPYYVLNGWGGIRKSECLRLVWDDVNWPTNQIKVTAKNAKSKRKRFCDIAEAPMEWLREYDDRTGPIMPSNHYRMFTEDRIKLGLYDNWERNSLRHSCGTYHVAMFRNKSKTQTLMGHKDLMMLEKHYDNAADKSEGLAWYNIRPSFSRSITSQRPLEKIN